MIKLTNETQETERRRSQQVNLTQASPETSHDPRINPFFLGDCDPLGNIPLGIVFPSFLFSFPFSLSLLPWITCPVLLLLLLLSRFSSVRLCATPETAAHQASPSLGFSRQEHWSGLPFPSPMYESGK